MRRQDWHRTFWLATALLLLFAALRLLDILHFPIFIDEVVHVDWADDVYALRPLTGAANGKLFGLWWMALFALEGDQAVLLARTATVLFALLGAALVYRLGASLAGQGAGLLALLLYAAQPYGIFYDRMALVDSYILPWALGCVWFCLRWLRWGRRFDALAAGVCITGAVLAKATGIMLAALPLLALLLLPSTKRWAARLGGVSWIAGAFAVTSSAVYVLLLWRGYAYFNTATTVVGTSATDSLWARLPRNISTMWAIDTAYYSIPFLLAGIILALALLWLRPRIGAFLLLALLVPLGGLLAFADKMSARYFQFHTPFLILLVAVGIHAVYTRLPRARNLLIGLALLWCIAFALPFFTRYLTDPAALMLPPLDREEYITSEGSGFALAEVADFLRTQAQPEQPGVVIGLIANCPALDSLIPASTPLRVECLVLQLDGTHQAAMIARVQTLGALGTPLWLVYEDLPYTDLRGLGAAEPPLATFSRPTDGVPIAIYRLSDEAENE